MSYVSYTRLRTPNAVLEKMFEFISSRGYRIIHPYSEDSDIYERTLHDGYRFTFMDKTNSYFITLRSCNGYQIFGLNDESTQDILKAGDYKDDRFSGIGMVVSDDFAPSTRWYNQFNSPLNKKADANGHTDVLGVYMPIPVPDFPRKYPPDPVEEPDQVEEPSLDLPKPPSPPIPPVKDIIKEPDEPKRIEKITLYNDKSKSKDMILHIIDHPYTYYLPPEANAPLINVGCSTNSIMSKGLVIDSVADILPGYKLIFDLSDFTNLRPSAYIANAYIDYKNGIDGYTHYSPDKMLLPPITRDNIELMHLPQSRTGLDFEVWEVIYKDFIIHHDDVTTIPNTRVPTLTMWNWTHNRIAHRGYVILAIKTETFDSYVNFSAIHKAWEDKTSQEWQDYFAKKAQIDAEYEANLTIYNAEKAQYDEDYANWLSTVAALKLEYSEKLSAYLIYLDKKAKYEDYLIALKEYEDWLAKLEEYGNRYTLYCNETLSEDSSQSTIVFSLVKDNSDYKQVTHLLVGNIKKYDAWNGGIIFSGSANRYNMITSNNIYDDTIKESDKFIYPLLGTVDETNTFLRINLLKEEGSIEDPIPWASRGEDNITGKQLIMPIRKDSTSTKAQIPHYYNIQSKKAYVWVNNTKVELNSKDGGKDANTLNNMTVNIPIYTAILDNPEGANLYAGTGEVIGVYFISLLNIATASVYKHMYPKDEPMCQVFPMGRRRGYYGFDGISIEQTWR